MKAAEIHCLFEYFTGEISGNKAYSTPINKHLTLINNFIKAIDEYYKGVSSLGTVFIWNYFTFQYNRHIDTPNARNNSIIDLHLIIGDNARRLWFELLKNNKVDYAYFVKINLLKRYPTLQFSYVDKILNPTPSKINDILYNEKQREIFLNTPRGFHNCFYHTTLYSGSSPSCRKCENTDLCLEIKAKIQAL